MQHILRIDASVQYEQSISRALGDELIERLLAQHPAVTVLVRDVNKDISFITETWVAANYTPPEERNDEQQAILAKSDILVAELAKADAVVMTVPIYNFSIPATLKAWIDQICRVGLTFSYTENGPQGLLNDKPVYLVMASGGVPIGSPADFASTYLKQVLGFIGMTSIQIIAAEQVSVDQEASIKKAQQQINNYLAQPMGA